MRTMFSLLQILTFLLMCKPAYSSERIVLEGHPIELYYGDFSVSSDGNFLLVAPNGTEIIEVIFKANFDSMCEVKKIDSTQIFFSINPSSAEASSCHLNIFLSDGKNIEITGFWASGE